MDVVMTWDSHFATVVSDSCAKYISISKAYMLFHGNCCFKGTFNSGSGVPETIPISYRQTQVQIEDVNLLVKVIIVSELGIKMLVDWGCLQDQHLKDLNDKVGVFDQATVTRCCSVNDKFFFKGCVQATCHVGASPKKILITSAHLQVTSMGIVYNSRKRIPTGENDVHCMETNGEEGSRQYSEIHPTSYVSYHMLNHDLDYNSILVLDLE